MDNLSRYTGYIQTILDLIALYISFFIAYAIKEAFPIGIVIPTFEPYKELLLVVFVGYMLIQTLILARESILTRNLSGELISAFKTAGSLFIILVLYLYVTKTSSDYSRIFVITYAVISFLSLILIRTLMKRWILPLFKSSKNADRLVMVGARDNISKAIRKMKESPDWRYQITGVILTDYQEGDEYLEQIDVLGSTDKLGDPSVMAGLDSVMLISPVSDRQTMDLINDLNEQGKTVSIRIEEYNLMSESKRIVDEVGGAAVVSYLPFMTMPKRYQFLKRLIDIVFALICLPLFLVVYVLTFIFSPGGPVIVRRVRVGKNGRRFYQDRFRTLRMDAEKQSENAEAPYTWWGRILSLTHLDGLAEVLNVLTGDMSFCGPHAPTLQRFLEYAPARRRNLCIKPGIVGGWSLEKEEEDVIFREREYIERWSIYKDFAIYFEMILRYLFGRSTRRRLPRNIDEELQLIAEYKEDNEPLQYDHSKYVHKVTIGERIYLIVKRLIDFVLSAVGIIVLSPVLLILSILVSANDGGSPIYKHTRVGLEGKKIQIYKFRSMRKDAGDLKKLLTPEQLAQYEKEFKIDDDPRITGIGEFIRKTSLDELPQLFNILNGDLSIVGPRPIVQKETEVYGDDIGKFLSAKPGLTGYWQAYARNNATYETGERQAMELYYIDHKSFWLDVKIFFKTFSSVLKQEGAQ